MDDKGPTVAFYYAMRLIKKLVDQGEITLSKRLKLILATDEETEWRGINYYKTKITEQPVAGFIPDAQFPLIYAEKGIVNVNVTTLIKSNEILEIKAGERFNMVPDTCSIKIKKMSQLVINQYFDYLQKNNYQGEIVENNLIIYGKSAHGSTPELGISALDLLSSFLLTIFKRDPLLLWLKKYYLADPEGEKLGIKTVDPQLGNLSNNLGVLSYDGEKLIASLNIRYFHGINQAQILEKIKKLKNTTTEVASGHELLYFAPDSFLVQSLLETYREVTGDSNAQALAIGGGTFARAYPNCVAFGPEFPGRPSAIHDKDEAVLITDLIQATQIYFQALLKLAA
jgi:succinyl-diaminopimelate desuccinylase